MYIIVRVWILVMMVCGLDAVASGRTNYILQCQGCHRANGEGIEGSVPDLNSSANIFLSSAAGRAFYIQVPGSANSPLTDAELADVLNYILSDIVGMASAQKFTEQEVQQHRLFSLKDVDKIRTRLLAGGRQKPQSSP